MRPTKPIPMPTPTPQKTYSASHRRSKTWHTATALPHPRIAVIASDPWPLPWYLRHFNQVGFWQPGQPLPDADFYITSGDASDQYADRLHNFRAEFFGIRPNVLILLWSPAPK